MEGGLENAADNQDKAVRGMGSSSGGLVRRVVARRAWFGQGSEVTGQVPGVG